MDLIIPNLKLGYRSLSAIHLSVVGVLGVVGLLLGLIRDRKLGSRRYNTLEKLYLVPGLQNLGNNCFLNVILQALASCSSFQPYLQKVMEECESSAISDSLQLTITLSSLLEELCVFGKGRVVLSPREVMLAMADYIPNFNLTSQQDAEEALLHLLSSLREEFSDCYLPSQSSLADSLASPGCRILTTKRRESQNEHERWQQYFLGPLDGILGSILTCQSCSSQISLNFQFFHSLPLSPVREGSGSIRVDCTLEDCLKQFIVAERVENYNCSHCWHMAAVKYLSLRGSNEAEIEKLRTCIEPDSCTCRSLIHLESLPWSNNFSCTIKQLRIARCPKILSIHIQRAFVNPFGEVIKLQGHVRFPLVLNMLPFMLKELPCQKPSPYPKVQCDRLFNQIHHQNTESTGFAQNAIGCTKIIETLQEGSILPQSRDFSDSILTDVYFEADSKVSSLGEVVQGEPQIYRLVSVVEHFGRAGGGHYTVYRSVRSESHERHLEENFDPSLWHWFCISDSEVYSVSEDDVLAAEASLLFYEKL